MISQVRHDITICVLVRRKANAYQAIVSKRLFLLRCIVLIVVCKLNQRASSVATVVTELKVGIYYLSLFIKDTKIIKQDGYFATLEQKYPKGI